MARFAARMDALLGATPASKGEWGLLIVDAESGETLYELNADKYFVPASNMKLFTTALALAKLGAGVPLPHHGGDAWCDFERGSAGWRSHARGAWRPESIEQKIPV